MRLLSKFRASLEGTHPAFPLVGCAVSAHWREDQVIVLQMLASFHCPLHTAVCSMDMVPNSGWVGNPPRVCYLATGVKTEGLEDEQPLLRMDGCPQIVTTLPPGCASCLGAHYHMGWSVNSVEPDAETAGHSKQKSAIM